MTDSSSVSVEARSGTNIAAFFWVSMIISVVGLAIATALNQPPLLVFATGMVPLVAYHVRLLIAVRRGLAQGAIDTVYYFGFLVTIATLAATVLKVAVVGDTQLDASALARLGATFGLGLLATGYALFARIQLMTFVQRFGEEDLGDRVDRYAAEAGKAVATITRSAAEFEVFSRTIRESAQRAVEESAAAAVESIGRMATANQEHLSTTFSGLTSSVNEVGSALRNAIPSDDLVYFQKGIKAINGGVSALGNQLRRLSERVTASDAAMKDLSASMASSVSAINGACVSMERIVSLGEPIAGLRISIASVPRQTVCNLLRV